jgi:hypothetical protein
MFLSKVKPFQFINFFDGSKPDLPQEEYFTLNSPGTYFMPCVLNKEEKEITLQYELLWFLD